MATASMNYAAAGTVTITLTSLADGSWRQSTAVDNTTNKYMDALLGGSIQTGTSPTADALIEVYLYASYDGTNYTGGASGTDSAYTADGEETLFKLAQVIIVDATSDQDYVFGPISVAQAFGGAMPSKWGVVIKNGSGAALNATGTNNEVQFLGVKYDVA